MSFPTLLQDAGVELVVSLVIKAKTGGDKSKEAARAAEGLAIITALTQLNSGDVASGMPALAGAFQNATTLDAGESLALQTFVGWASQKLSSSVEGAIVGQIESGIVANVLTAAAKACNAYLPKAA